MPGKRTQTPAQTRPAATPTATPRRVFDADKADRRVIRARYDVARTTAENASLWTGADSLSAATANNPQVRRVIRDRARYEVANNSYAAGIVSTLANDTIGPQVQIQLGDSDLAQQVEAAFHAWADAVGLWAKMRTMWASKITDGESFGVMFSNPKVGHEIKLDVRPIECDMVEGWVANINRVDEIDGIKFDTFGNPTDYRFLKFHPGDHRDVSTGAGEWVKRRYMLHVFSPRRPGQVRGVSELVSCLSLFGQLRKFTSAVIETATRAAEVSVLMHTKLLPDGMAAELADPVTILQAERNAIMSLPEGWDATQLKPEQPTTTYPQFKAEIINEMARPLNMPFNVAAGNSSSYNYASGRLDHQTYDRSIDVARAEANAQAFDRIYSEWLAEYAARHALTADELVSVSPHEWHYVGRGHVDPNKEANADNSRLANGTLTHARYWARQGSDWKREEAQRIRELVGRETMWNKARADAGLPPAPYPSAMGQSQPVAQPAAKPEEAEDE